MKTFKMPLIALGLLALLGLYIRFFEKGPVKNPEEAPPGEKIFLKAADDVAGFTMEAPSNPKAKPIQLVKDGAGKWAITQPMPLEADESSIRNLLNTLAESRLENEWKDQKNLADYGLNTPSARYTVKMKDGSVFHLETGDKNVNGTAYFSRVDGRTGVGLLPSDLIQALGHSLRDYRNKVAFRVDISGLSKIRIKAARGALVLEKSKTGDWNLVEPRKEPASSDMIRQFLSSVDAFRHSDFPDDHPSSLGKYGLDPPKASLEVWYEGSSKSRALWVGKLKDHNAFVKDRDQAFVALDNEGILKLLENKKPEDFKSKEAMKFNESQAVRLVLRKGARTVTFSKDATGTWKSAERPSAPTEAPPLLAQLASTMVLEFVSSGTATGLSEPSAVAEVTLNQNEVRTFKFGKRKEDRVYLASDRSKDAYLVSGYVLTQIEGLLMPAPPAPPPTASL